MTVFPCSQIFLTSRTNWRWGPIPIFGFRCSKKCAAGALRSTLSDPSSGSFALRGDAPSEVLWRAASTGGRLALGLSESGPSLAINQRHHLLTSAEDSSFLDALVFGGDERVLGSN